MKERSRKDGTHQAWVKQLRKICTTSTRKLPGIFSLQNQWWKPSLQVLVTSWWRFRFWTPRVNHRPGTFTTRGLFGLLLFLLLLAVVWNFEVIQSDCQLVHPTCSSPSLTTKKICQIVIVTFVSDSWLKDRMFGVGLGWADGQLWQGVWLQ